MAVDDNLTSDGGHEYQPVDVPLLIAQIKFWAAVAAAAAERNSLLELEPGSPAEILARQLRYTVRDGLEASAFVPTWKPYRLPGQSDEEIKQVVEQWQDRIPWALVRRICGEYNIDANEILDEFIEASDEVVAQAQAIRDEGRKRKPESQPMQVGDLPPELAEQVMDAMLEGSDQYVLHVIHNGHSCRHPYDTLDMAVEAGANGELDGHLEQAVKIERHGKIVLDESALRRRIDDIKAAPRN